MPPTTPRTALPVSTLPICQEDTLANLQRNHDINQDGYSDRVQISPQTLEVWIAFGKADGFYPPVKQLDRRYLKAFKNLKLFGMPLAELLGKRPPTLSPELRRMFNLGPSSEIDFKQVTRLSFELFASPTGVELCELVVLFKGKLRLTHVDVAKTLINPNIHPSILWSNPYENPPESPPTDSPPPPEKQRFSEEGLVIDNPYR